MWRCRGFTSLATILIEFARAERRVSPSQDRFASPLVLSGVLGAFALAEQVAGRGG